MTQSDDYRSLYLSYLKYCNDHDFDSMASFYTPTIKVNDAPMEPAAVTAQFAPLISAFPDWHWEMRHIIVDDDGPGLSPQQREQVARRGRRLDETKPGSGLGLSIVVDLASLYGGSLALGTAPIGGLRAELILPGA